MENKTQRRGSFKLYENGDLDLNQVVLCDWFHENFINHLTKFYWEFGKRKSEPVKCYPYFNHFHGKFFLTPGRRIGFQGKSEK